MSGGRGKNELSAKDTPANAHRAWRRAARAKVQSYRRLSSLGLRLGALWAGYSRPGTRWQFARGTPRIAGPGATIVAVKVLEGLAVARVD